MSALLAVEPDPAAVAAAVTSGEYARLLGWPRARPLTEDLETRAVFARDWYARHGRPWAAARRLPLPALGTSLLTAAASGAAAFAVTAGREVADEAQRLWRAERPDEAYFLDRFAAAVAEQMVGFVAIAICRQAGSGGETALFHESPGCGSWPLEEQGRLASLLFEDAPADRLHLLPSGMLEPVHSMLGVLALARSAAAPSPADGCRRCDLEPCGFRRAPYRGAA